MQKVLIVKEGRWVVKTESYQELVEMYKKVLDRAEDEGNKMAMVEIIGTAKEAEKRAEMADVVVFVSRGMEDEAEKLAKAFPRLKVIVFTGDIPQSKVIWVNKTWATEPETIQNIVLRY